MRTIWSFAGCDRAQEAQLAQLWLPREAELDGKLGCAAADQRCLARLSIERTTEPVAWFMRSAVFLPNVILASECEHNDPIALLDETLAALSRRFDQFQEESSDQRARPRRDSLALTRLFESLHRAGRSQDFVGFMLPLLNSLRRYARHELQTRRAVGELPAGQTSVRELLDEVTVVAWERFARKPSEQPIELWLVLLIDEALDRVCQPIAQQSLEERQPLSTDIARDQLRSEWADYPTEPESIELSRLIPDGPSLGAWDELDVESKQSRLDEIFGQLPRLQRQVLMLHMVEGFSRSEIADFQDRTAREVDEDLAAAERVVRRIVQERGLLQMEEKMENDTFSRNRRTHRS